MLLGVLPLEPFLLCPDPLLWLGLPHHVFQLWWTEVPREIMIRPLFPFCQVMCQSKCVTFAALGT